MQRKILVSLILGIGVALILCLLFIQGFFLGWQNRLSDSLFQPRPASKEIVIIAIDDKSISEVGRWPWNRSIHAKLLEKLGTKPAVIGFDVMFSEPSNQKDDTELAQAIKNSSPIVFPLEAAHLNSNGNVDNILKPLSQFTASASAGIVNLISDSDGITRKVPLSAWDEAGQRQPTFSCLIVVVFGQDEEKCVYPYHPIRINYVGQPGSFIQYSYSDVLSGQVPPETFNNKIVLIGATAPDLHDDVLTPVSGGKPMSGIEAHANTIQTILEQKFLNEESQNSTLVTIFLISILMAIILRSTPLWLSVIIALVSIALYILYAISGFDKGTIRNIVYPVLAIILTFITQLIYRYFSEYKQKSFLRRAFSYYLSESVLKTIINDPKQLKLGGQRKELTVLFSDIAGFTTISEKLEPELLTQLLNNYLTRMTNLVFKYNGVLDKYIGDAVMAFWGAPLPEKDHALLACKTALEMQSAIEELKSQWKTHNIGNFSVRIGINTGEMAVGNMGSESRFDYTLIGDNVNLGSRLEGINKEYGTSIIIAQSTYEKVKDQVVARLLDVCAVKGKAKGVIIYELRSLGKQSTKEKVFLESFEQARKIYEQGQFKKALTAFTALAKRYLADGPTKTYIVRCQELIKNPPQTWDGIFHAQSK